MSFTVCCTSVQTCGFAVECPVSQQARMALCVFSANHREVLRHVSRILPSWGRTTGQLCICSCPPWQPQPHPPLFYAAEPSKWVYINGRCCVGAGAVAALAPAGSVQWIINDWDAYDAAWESAYAYLSDGSDDDSAWGCKSDDDGCVGGGARVSSGQGRTQPPARAQDVLLPWDT